MEDRKVPTGTSKSFTKINDKLFEELVSGAITLPIEVMFSAGGFHLFGLQARGKKIGTLIQIDKTGRWPQEYCLEKFSDWCFWVKWDELYGEKWDYPATSLMFNVEGHYPPPLSVEECINFLDKI